MEAQVECCIERTRQMMIVPCHKKEEQKTTVNCILLIDLLIPINVHEMV